MNMYSVFARFALLGALVAPALSGLAQQVSVPPQALLSRDSNVIIRVSSPTPFALGRESVTMANNSIVVTMRSFDNMPDPGPSPPANDVATSTADVVLGRLPQGQYSVEVRFLNRVSGLFTALGSTQLTVAADAFSTSSGYSAYDFTDLWWNPNESGWGISIHSKRQNLFAAWFVYDSTGKPTWYTLQMGTWLAPNKYSGRIFATRADPNSGVGPMSSLVVTEVGTGTILFNGFDQAVFSYVIDGKENSKSIMREIF